MQRRDFIKTSALASSSLLLPGFSLAPIKSHILTLSFDDGFKKSFYKTAEIHEEYGLKACLNVIASGHFKTFNTEPQWIPQNLLGNFDDWNTLKQRGHEIMPHTWEHLNLTKIPFTKAKQNIDKCLNYFEENLEGYSSSNAVYNFAYNASNKALDDYTLKKVKAIRTGGWLVLNNSMVNPIPISNKQLPMRLGAWGHGPDFCDNYVEQEINKFLKSKGEWLILNLHGLDTEGWGPISSNYLDKLLKRLTKVDYLEVLPVMSVIKRVEKN